MKEKKTTVKRKKKIIDEYHPNIYPRRLWVCKNCEFKDLNKKFCNIDGTDLNKEWYSSDKYDALTVRVMDRKNKYLGIMIALHTESKDKIELVKICSHEAEHVKFMIFDDCAICSNYDAQEADAYLIGWTTQCIFKTAIK